MFAYLKLEAAMEGYYVVFDHRRNPGPRVETETLDRVTLRSYVIPVVQEMPSSARIESDIVENAARLRRMFRRGIEIAKSQGATALDDTISVLVARNAPSDLVAALQLTTELMGDTTAEDVRAILTHLEGQRLTPQLARMQLFFEEYYDILTTPTPEPPVASDGVQGETVVPDAETVDA